jgi:hypothetical protein
VRNKQKNALLPLSRRALLLGTAGAASTTALLGIPSNTASAQKLSQRVVAYQDHPEGDKRCDRCAQFQPPTACKIVDGTVSPGGYCKFYTPRSQA